MPGRTNATIISGTGGTSSKDPILREYITNSVWTKPADIKYVHILAVGGGGGGASGTRLAGTGLAYGGAGGLGGYILNEIVPASSFGATVAVVVGSGGRGGTASTGSSVVAGSDGMNSSFGPYIAKGGWRGFSTNQSYINTYIDASNAPCGGPGGYAMAATNETGYDGGGMYITSSVISIGGKGGTASFSNGANGSQGFNYVKKVFGSTYGIGTGGGGGGGQRNTGTFAGNGGTGGLYGAGGGGGGACNSSAYFISGTGGNGANGVVFVVEIY